MMAAACKISFKIKYTSSLPITQATAFYKLKDATSFTKYDIPSPLPVSDITMVELPEIDTPDEYDLKVELAVNGITASNTGSFKIGKCNPVPCSVPAIGRLYLGENEEIIMQYSVDTDGFFAVQYQVATDSDFKNIVQLKVIMANDYNPTEYFEMNDGTIQNNTQLYVRVRKYCSSSEVSDWSPMGMIRSGNWIKQNTLYPFDVFCVSDKFNAFDPTNISEFKASICITDRNPLQKKIKLTTPTPQIGSVIYTNGLTPDKPAIPGMLANFDDSQGVSTGFNQSGIRWIKFQNDSGRIYNVDPKTGRIVGISGFKCSV